MKKKIVVKSKINTNKCKNDCGRDGTMFHRNGMWVCLECHNKWDRQFEEMIEGLKGNKTLF